MKEHEEDELHTDSSDRHKKNSNFVITIPSYDQVVESSHSNPSLFTPSPSFSQAFSFLKSSEFYSPPPPPAAVASSSAISSDSVSSSQLGQSSSSSASTAVASGQNRNTILVSHRQKGNPLLKYIRNVKWAFADIVSDYLVGQSSCALYLSLRYHLLHPDYLYYRIRELQKNFKLRVVLCHVDVEDVVKPLLEVTKIALLHDCTLLCAWSLEECGRYLETIKVYENKPADIIQGQMDTDYLSRLNHALTTVRHVNKTDVITLGSTFGSLSTIMDASMEDLARCPGIGERKVKRLYDTFHEPFKREVSICLAVPESPVQNIDEISSVSGTKEVEKDEEAARKRRKKEPELTVKSALSTAFAKYAAKVGRKTDKVKEKPGDTSIGMGEETVSRGNNEGAVE